MHTYVCGAMKREIFLYGHFGDGHCLGRYICPDDLSDVSRTKRRTGAIWLLFSFVRYSYCSVSSAVDFVVAGSRPSARNIALMPLTA